jgi:hypothetical protein
LERSKFLGRDGKMPLIVNVAHYVPKLLGVYVAHGKLFPAKEPR